MGKILIIISGIGTGGHYFPAIVVAKEFLKYKQEVIFIARRGYPEEEVAKNNNLRIFHLNPRPYYGKSLLHKVYALFKVMESVVKLNKVVKKGIGISFGGFGSLPLIVSCIINRRPFYLFEPNRIPGKTTRFFAACARKVFLGMPCGIEMRCDQVITGIPVREEFKKVSKAQKRSTRRTVLFMGGSQGARKLNEFAIKLQKILPKEYRIVIISGKRDFEWVDKEKDCRTEVIPFTNAPWETIAEADVVVSRAGALSGYELLVMKKSVLFVPFPYAVDNHQYHNAQYFIQVPNVKMELEENLNEDILLNRIKELFQAETPEVSIGGLITACAEKEIVNTVIAEGL